SPCLVTDLARLIPSLRECLPGPLIRLGKPLTGALRSVSLLPHPVVPFGHRLVNRRHDEPPQKAEDEEKDEQHCDECAARKQEVVLLLRGNRIRHARSISHPRRRAGWHRTPTR